ncbi:GAD-like domain-containing protein, partial [Acinetobacter guillouiae]|uniref:GAD-like domain-containing protein n=1 Tax=Acinetobacter guillouiae TaxID=106649 RepID=UPI0026E3DDB7
MQLQTLIEKKPVEQVGNKLSPETVKKYQACLPEALLEIWQNKGFGFYGNVLLHIINHYLYQYVIWSWLMKNQH